MFPSNKVLVIRELRYRPSAGWGDAFSATISDLQINLSTTAAAVDGLSATFANNVGADDRVVFNGSIDLSSAFCGPRDGPKDFDIIIPLTTPFRYNPARGNLLIDYRNRSGSDAPLIDTGVGNGASRAFALGAGSTVAASVDQGGEVVQLVYTEGEPEPEPPLGGGLIIPPVYATTDSGGGSSVLHHEIRLQNVYSSRLFPSNKVLVIRELRYRPSAVWGNAFSTTIANLQINLSATDAEVNGLSATFANNVGANDTVVFNGSINLSSAFAGPVNGPKEFDIVIPLTTPFRYNPAQGNLLIDYRNRSGSGAANIDAGSGNGASRVFALGANSTVAQSVDQGAEVVQLVYTEGEPGPVTPPPVIASFTPRSGPTGTVVTITGDNFHPSLDGNRVYFGAARARVLNASNNVLTVQVPVGATYEPISVNTRNLIAFSDLPFVVTFESSRTIHTGSFTGFNLPAGDLPMNVSIGDMEGNGKLDFVALNHFDSTVGVYLNHSTNFTLAPEHFGPPRIYPTGPLPYHMALANVDGAGGIDVITANRGDNTISLLRNTPAGIFAFAPGVSFPTGQDPVGLATGDLDKDGRVDIVVANNDSDSITILRQTSNPGLGTNAPSFDILELPVGDGPHNVVIADIDGDSRPDIAVANYHANTLSILRNLTTGPGIGPGSFAPGVTFAPGGNCIAFGDLDGDGRGDLAIAEWNTQVLALYRNVSSPGTIALSEPATFEIGNKPYTIAISDLDGDARVDLSLVGQLPSFMCIFKNRATPGVLNTNSFAPRVDFPSGWNAVGLSAGDLNGDGRPDLVFANAYDDNLTVYQNRTANGGTNMPSLVITEQPQSQTVEVGGTAIFHVGVSGTSPFGYRWRRNGITIAPAPGSDRLIISNVQPSHAGVYSVVVTNAANPAPGVLSSNAVLTVIGQTNALPPRITQQPQSQTVPVGGTATFSVQAAGTLPFRYQWVKGGVELGGATNRVLTMTNVQTNHAGVYSVRVSNTAGSVTSESALLTVTPPGPEPPGGLIIPPVYATIDSGGGSSVLHHELRLQNVYSSRLFPSNKVLVIRELRYRPSVIWGNAFSTTISNIQINLSTTDAEVDGLSATFAQNVGGNDTVVFNGSINISSAFNGPANGPKAFDIVIPLTTPFRYNPAQGNLLIDYRNRSGSGAANIDAGVGNGASRVFALGANSTVAQAVDQGAEVVQMICTEAEPEPEPPPGGGLVIPPAYTSTEGAGGSSVLLHAIRLQNVYSSALFPSNKVLVIRELRYRPSARDGGPFSTRISNLQINLSTTRAVVGGLSGTFANNVGSNDTVVFNGGINISSAFEGPLGGPKEFDIIIPLSTPFRYNPAQGNLLIDYRNRSGSGASRIDSGVGNGASRVFALGADSTVAQAVDQGAEVVQLIYTDLGTNQPPPPPAADHDLSRDFAIEAGNPNGVWSYGWQGTVGGPFNLFTFSKISHDPAGTPVEVWEKPISVPSVQHNNSTNTVVVDGGQGNFPPETTWFYPGVEGYPENFGVIRFTVPAGRGGTYDLATGVRPAYSASLQRDTDFHVLKNGVELFSRALNVSDTAGYTNRLALAAGETVDFVIGRGADDSFLWSGLKIEARLSRTGTNNQVAPTIVSQPTNQMVLVGGTARFTVDASGSAPLNYQWHKGATPIFGARQATLTLTNVQLASAGEYSVVVSNAFGSATSQTATLTVNASPPAADHDLSRDFAIEAGNPNGVWSYGWQGTVGGPFNLFTHSKYNYDSAGVPIEVWDKPNSVPAVQHNNSTSTAVTPFDGNYPPETTWFYPGVEGYAENFGVIRFTVPSGLGGTYNVATTVRPVWDSSYQKDTDFHVLRNGVELFGRALNGLATAGFSNVVTLATGDTIDFVIGRGADNSYIGSGLKIEARLSRTGTNNQVAPAIVSQPASQTVLVGSTVSFTVGATGSAPLNYQWHKGATPIFGARQATLTLTNVQLAAAGDYSVVVSNAFGTATSQTATLTVNSVGGPGTNCLPVQQGLVSWWRAEGNAQDSRGTNHGTAQGATFAAGRIGQAFSFDGDDRIAVPDSASLELNSMTVEGWLNIRDWPSAQNAFSAAMVVYRGDDRSGLDPFYVVVLNTGVLRFAINSEEGDFEAVDAPVVANRFVHFAATLDDASGAMRLYLDGALVAQTNTSVRPVGNLGPFGSGLGIGNGQSGSTFAFGLNGLVDEVKLYSRALSGAEVQLLHTNASCTNQPPPPGVDHDLSRDFAIEAGNPNGVWSYGWQGTLGGPFNLFTFSKTYSNPGEAPMEFWEKPWSVPSVIHNNSTNTVVVDGGQGVFPPETTLFYPGVEGEPENFGVIRFTVPSGGGGTYDLATTVRPAYSASLQLDTDFHVLKNGVELFGRALNVSDTAGYTNSLELAAGDTIDFVIGRGADNSFFWSGLKITATLRSSRATATAHRISLAPVSEGRFTFGLAPASSGRYIVETSTDLVNWTALTDEVSGAGLVETIGPRPSTRQRFYRARLTP
jgi:hypothetical protein